MFVFVILAGSINRHTGHRGCAGVPEFSQEQMCMGTFTTVDPVSLNHCKGPFTPSVMVCSHLAEPGPG